MSNKVIIDTTTGTVLDVADCYVVDADLVNDDVLFDDSVLAEIAEKYGKSVIDFLPREGRWEVELIDVKAHWDDEVAEFAVEHVFGRLPKGFDGDIEGYPEDEQVSFWLEHDEELVVGGQYGDFIVTEIEGGEK
jgi:hypothetical protein